MKRLYTWKYIFALTMALVVSPVFAATTESDIQLIESDIATDVEIQCIDNVLYIRNAENMVLKIFSITGKMLLATKIDSPSKKIETSSYPRGFYLVNVGNVTRKIYIE